MGDVIDLQREWVRRLAARYPLNRLLRDIANAAAPPTAAFTTTPSVTVYGAQAVAGSVGSVLSWETARRRHRSPTPPTGDRS